MEIDEERENGNNAGDWSELTHECLVNILTRLPLEDRWRGAMRVCKAWHEACKDPYVNTKLHLEEHFNASSELPQFWTPEFERRIDNTVSSVVDWSAGCLTEIRVRHCSGRSLSLVAKRCPNLQVLSIKSCPHVTDRIMAEIAFGCPQIKELDISYCYKISYQSLAIIGSHCPNLHILKRNLMNSLDPSQHIGFFPNEYLNSCPQDGDSEASAISKFMPRLLHLELRFSKLTAKGLAMISCEGCPDLEYADLSGCPLVTAQDIFNCVIRRRRHLMEKGLPGHNQLCVHMSSV